MLPLLKKKSEAPAVPLVPAWHPNFRNYEKLPDIKVVRTAFFVNGAAISLAIALAIFFGFQEWQLYGLRSLIGEAERQIARDKAGSTQAIAQFKKFQTEESRITEVETFVKSKPVISALISHLARTLPVNVAIDTLDLRDTGLVLRLTVRGTRDAAAGYATAYLEQLKVDKVLAERFEAAEMTSIAPNPATGRLAVELTLRLKGSKK